MCKFLSKIKKRSKLKSREELVEQLVKNDNISVVPNSSDSFDIVKSEISENDVKRKTNINDVDLSLNEPKKKKKKTNSTLAELLSNDVPDEIEGDMVSHSLEDEMERLNVDDSNETNGEVENYDNDENGATCNTSPGEVFPVIGDFKFKTKNKVG